MNKRMRDLLNQIKDLQAQADDLIKEGKGGEDVQNIFNKIALLQNAYNTEKETFRMEKDGVPADGDPKDKISGFTVLNKMMKKQGLTEAENALIRDGADGENYLLPEDVDTAIRESRKGCKSLKELVTVYPTTALAGTNVYDSEDNELLDAFQDGEEIPDATNPKFVQKKWSIDFFGKTIPVSNILLGAEKSSLMAYINRWFIRKAIKTENKAIIETLKDGKEAVEISGIKGIKTVMNKDIEPEYLIDGVILTNQTGFDYLDNETDAVGRPILTKDLENPSKKRLNGLLIEVISDAEMANVDGKAPIFIGSLKAGVAFYEYASLQFAISEHVFFSKNQTALRVIEGFATMQEFSDAYVYGLLSADNNKVVKTKAAE